MFAEIWKIGNMKCIWILHGMLVHWRFLEWMELSMQWYTIQIFYSLVYSMGIFSKFLHLAKKCWINVKLYYTNAHLMRCIQYIPWTYFHLSYFYFGMFQLTHFYWTPVYMSENKELRNTIQMYIHFRPNFHSLILVPKLYSDKYITNL